MLRLIIYKNKIKAWAHDHKDNPKAMAPALDVCSEAAALDVENWVCAKHCIASGVTEMVFV